MVEAVFRDLGIAGSAGDLAVLPGDGHAVVDAGLATTPPGTVTGR